MFYVGLAPTMGFVGYSWVAASDKYAYLPAVGLVLVVGWVLERLWQSGQNAAASRRRRATAVAAVLAAACLLGLGTRRYLSYWQTTEGLLDYMLALAPNSPNLHCNHGAFFLDRGDNGRALAEYNIAITLYPFDSAAYVNRGIAMSNLGQTDRAIEDYNKAIELKGDDPDAYTNRGVAYADKGAYPRAIADHNKAIELRPDFTNAYNNRGAARSHMGDYKGAIDDYNKSIELKNDFVPAYRNRAVAYYYLKQYDKSWADVRAVRRLGGTPDPNLIRLLNQSTEPQRGVRSNSDRTQATSQRE
jgi:tetratricopeptide (TPR) repeat protein